MTKLEEKKYQKYRLDIFLSELYNLEAEQAFAVDLIPHKLKDIEKSEFRINQLNDQISVIDSKTKEGREKIKNLELERGGVQFILNRDRESKKKVFDQIVDRGIKIKALKKNIDQARKLNLSKVTQLPYLEVNGTQYQAKDNMPVYNDKGEMILYLKKNVKDNTTQKAQD
jgi:hypothetical protein